MFNVVSEENFFQYLYHINQMMAKRRLAVVSALEHYLNNPEVCVCACVCVCMCASMRACVCMCVQ